MEDDREKECRRDCCDESTCCNLDSDILLKRSLKDAKQDDNIRDINYTKEPKEGQYFRIGGQMFCVTNPSGADLTGANDTENKRTNDHLTKQFTRIYIVQHLNNSDGALEREHCILLLSVHHLGENIYGSTIQSNVKEAGHITAFTLKGEAYWVIGQKNVRIVLRYNFPEEDLATFQTEYYGGVLEFALLCKDFFKRHTQKFEEGGLYLRNFHHTLAEKGWTCYSERVPCNNCDLQDQNTMGELRFYAIIQNDVPDGNENTEHIPNNSFCVDVDHAEIFLKDVGFIFSKHIVQVTYRGPEHHVILGDINHNTDSVECNKHNCSDQSNKTRLHNNNSAFYQLECAAQEAIMVRKLFGENLRKHLLEEIKFHGKRPPNSVFNWKKRRLSWLLGFASWLHTVKRLDPSVEYSIPLDDDIWHSLQDEFKKSLSTEDNLNSFGEYCKKNIFNSREIIEDQDIVQIDGPPGCGKTTLSQTLFFLLKQACFVPGLFTRKKFEYDAEGLYHIDELMFRSKKLTHLILDGIQTDALLDVKSPESCPTVTVLWQHEDDPSKFDSVCSEQLKSCTYGNSMIRLERFSASPDNNKEEISEISKGHFGLTHEGDGLERGHVVMLDKTMSLLQLIQVVWNALSKGGKHKLPELDTLDVELAVNTTREYKILSYGHIGLPIYASIEIINPRKTLLPHIPREFLFSKKVQESFHVTTKYFGGVKSPLIFAELRALENKEIDLRLVWVLSDSHGTAVVVRNRNGREFPCGNLFPHITIATSCGIRPVYSNELCMKASRIRCTTNSPIKMLKLPPASTVRGRFSFFYP